MGSGMSGLRMLHLPPVGSATERWLWMTVKRTERESLEDSLPRSGKESLERKVEKLREKRGCCWSPAWFLSLFPFLKCAPSFQRDFVVAAISWL